LATAPGTDGDAISAGSALAGFEGIGLGSDLTSIVGMAHILS
jgi:hypothetical protein